MNKDELIKEIIFCWGKGYKLSCAVARAAGFAREDDMSPEDWESVWEEAFAIYPKLVSSEEIRYMTTPLWVARFSRNANFAFWDGNIALAKRWLESGKDKSSERVQVSETARERAKERKLNRGVVFIEARSLGKEHDWKTCK